VRERPSEGSEGESKWIGYLYFRENPSGPLKEWWCHEKGCGLWFIALRDTSTQEVSWTRLRSPADER
jgi:sarcosine oxidase subunit delta